MSRRYPDPLDCVACMQVDCTCECQTCTNARARREQPTDAPAPAEVPEWQRIVDRCLDKLDAQIAPPAPTPAAEPCEACQYGICSAHQTPLPVPQWKDYEGPITPHPLDAEVAALRAELAQARDYADGFERTCHTLMVERDTALARVAQLEQEREETVMLAECPGVSSLKELAQELAYRAQRIIALEALVQQVEWEGSRELKVCPWCGASRIYAAEHAKSCPAFGASARGAQA